MISKRQALLLATLGMVGVMMIGASGASSVTAERGVEMAVAGDNAAVVGFEQRAIHTANGTTELELTVRNQFGTEIELTAIEVGVGGTTEHLAENSPLEPGEHRTERFVGVSCTDEITVHVSGTDIDSRFDRPVQC
ncbi:hypothetical protein [Halohasta litorea]|uniref:CARDB protein n=1 Tax=Halohasta litorea TaxID=869891 RepID=A0ABD6D6J4_9EURY|nr:hypothetical protein [Halohasta litorea]MEA1930027.1 hypothetical protein [Euryarchaeota archaeon]